MEICEVRFIVIQSGLVDSASFEVGSISPERRTHFAGLLRSVFIVFIKMGPAAFDSTRWVIALVVGVAVVLTCVALQRASSMVV